VSKGIYELLTRAEARRLVALDRALLQTNNLRKALELAPEIYAYLFPDWSITSPRDGDSTDA
jgi:hypothetical protein